MAAILSDVLESAREPGTSRFSASSIAGILGLQQQDLAELAGVHRNTLRTHPESPRLQSVLRDLMRVLSAATVLQPDPQRAIFLIKNEPIPAFRHKTLLQLVQEGRTEDAIDYLESVSSGFVG
ncbi:MULTISPECIES: DNA-binding protein [unclassified Thauera]|uniref:DNA-binding protein n=1 Tax=unclassified Thauera TaxID=2609274 RepID=UPI0021E100AD|nr:DNA-binding protein [Thauera sp. Sel9]MCV2217165.1 DNA-binding protein [Thauera sp. Sel9]